MGKPWLSSGGSSGERLSKRAQEQARQLAIELALALPALERRGGRRRGAGRKPTHGRARLRHAARPAHHARLPVHVTLRAKLRSLRNQVVLPVFARAIRATNARAIARFRVVHYSLQHDHVHLLVEAEDKAALSRGMQGLAVRIARNVNRALSRAGRFWADRYHARELSSPREVRNAIVYVHSNFRKHLPELPSGLDPYSSSLWFDGFREARPLRLALAIPRNLLDLRAPPVVPARTWLLATGWKRRGLIAYREAPASTSQA